MEAELPLIIEMAFTTGHPVGASSFLEESKMFPLQYALYIKVFALIICHEGCKELLRSLPKLELGEDALLTSSPF